MVLAMSREFFQYYSMFSEPALKNSLILKRRQRLVFSQLLNVRKIKGLIANRHSPVKKKKNVHLKT